MLGHTKPYVSGILQVPGLSNFDKMLRKPTGNDHGVPGVVVRIAVGPLVSVRMVETMH